MKNHNKLQTQNALTSSVLANHSISLTHLVLLLNLVVHLLLLKYIHIRIVWSSTTHQLKSRAPPGLGKFSEIEESAAHWYACSVPWEAHDTLRRPAAQFFQWPVRSFPAALLFQPSRPLLLLCGCPLFFVLVINSFFHPTSTSSVPIFGTSLIRLFTFLFCIYHVVVYLFEFCRKFWRLVVWYFLNKIEPSDV